MKPTRTPTPWFIKNGQLKGQGLTTGVLYGGNPTELWRANAAFIVKAVNCHERLVNQLKAVLPVIEHERPGMAVTIKNLLAKAEAE